jgi:SAM-dependent methyltransferase
MAWRKISPVILAGDRRPGRLAPASGRGSDACGHDRGRLPASQRRSRALVQRHLEFTGSLIGFLDAANAPAGLRAAKQALLDQLRLGQVRNVLDVGCGTGTDLMAIAERRAAVPSTGLLTWVLSLDGYRLSGSYLSVSNDTSAGETP